MSLLYLEGKDLQEQSDEENEPELPEPEEKTGISPEDEKEGPVDNAENPGEEDGTQNPNSKERDGKGKGCVQLLFIFHLSTWNAMDVVT